MKMSEEEKEEMTDWLIAREECVEEDKNQKYIVQLTDDQYRNLVENISKETKKEFEQKVKDKIEKLKLSGGSDEKDNVENLVRELAIEVLEELLEDK